MNRNRLWAIIIGVLAILVLLYIFTATGGPEEVEDLEAPVEGIDEGTVGGEAEENGEED